MATLIIDNNTGNLVIKGSKLISHPYPSEYFFRGAANGAVTIYLTIMSQSLKPTDGISVTDLALPDSGELRLGTDNDMQIPVRKSLDKSTQAIVPTR